MHAYCKNAPNDGPRKSLRYLELTIKPLFKTYRDENTNIT